MNSTQTTILLVEDQALIAMSEAQMLERHGYEVVTVHSGEKAIEAVDSDTSISLILMDIDLGSGMDGTEAAEKILRRKDIPIVFLSSHTEPEIVEKTEKITSYGYVVKNSGMVVLDASIKMAFKLFDAKMQEQQHEAELLDTTNYLRSILRTARDGFDVVDMNGNILDVNNAHCEMFGYSREEFLQLSISDIDPDETPDLTAERAEQIRSSGYAVFDARGLRKDGTVFDVEVSASFLGGEKNRIVAFYRDITERKKAEEKLKAQKDRLQSIIEDGFDFISLTDIDGNYEFVGNSQRVFGYEDNYLLGKNLIAIFDPENINNLKSALSEWLQNADTQVKGESRVPRADGSYIWVESIGKKIFGDGGEIKELLWINRDITERKEAEKQLRESEGKYLALFSQAVEAIYVHDYEGHMVDVNEAACQQTGYSKSELLQLSVFDIHVTGDDTVNPSEAETKRVWKQSKLGERHAFEAEHRRKDGTIFPVRLSTGAIGYGDTSAMMAIVEDVTERKPPEQALRESEAMCRLVLDHSSDLIWNLTVEGVLTYASPSWLRVTGYDPEVVQDSDLTEIVHSEDISNCMDYIGELTGTKRVSSPVTYRVRHADGSWHWHEATGAPVLGPEGEVESIVGVSRDITERKQTEENLRLKSSFIDRIAEVSPDIFIVSSKDGEYLEIIGNEDRMYRRKEELMGSRVGDVLPEPAASIIMQGIDEAISTNAVKTVQYELEGKNNRFFCEVRITPLYEDKVLRQVIDITERKQAEHEIQRQLAEKETLLKEAHHRIKNNLVQVESLLSVQAESAYSGEVKSALAEAISRVQSSRTLYEKLLGGDTYEEVSTTEYLESLIDSIAEVFHERPSMTVEKRIADFALSSRKAIPVGIILNELLTNVFKYAFKGRDDGQVVIELDRTEGQVTLTVWDNGIGIENADAVNESPGFGLTIVHMLAEQLTGTFAVESENGTKAALTFQA